MDRLERVGRIQLRHAARIVDDEHGFAVAIVAEIQFQRGQAVIHGVVQEGVDDRRRGTGIFALAAAHLVGQHDGRGAEKMPRELIADDFLDKQLVLGLHHRVHQRDDEDLDAVVDELADAIAHVFRVDGHDDLAGFGDALANADDHLNGHERRGALRHRQVAAETVRQALAITAAAAQRHHRLEAGGDNEADAGAAALDQRVGTERRCVADAVHFAHDFFQR